MSAWADTVPLLVDGQDASQAILNPPLQALIDRTDYLKAQLLGITDRTNIVIATAVLDTATVEGDLVYFDTLTGSYRQSLAAWSTIYGANGDLLPAASCRVDALVVGKTTSTAGDILVAGEYASSAIATKLFGLGGALGMYYLSATVAGGVSATQPPISVPAVINSDGTDIIFAARLAPQPNHLHKAFTLAGSWLALTDSSFTGMTIPGTAVYGYDIANDAAVTELFAAMSGQMVFFDAAGKLLGTADVSNNTDNIWWYNGTTAPTVLTMFAYVPFTHGEPIIRAAQSTTPLELEVTAVNGLLSINSKPWASATAVPSGYAVSDFTGRVKSVTPVVSSVVPGAGITASLNATTGVVTLSSSQAVGAQLEAEIVDLNNAVEEVDSPHFYYTLPALRSASVLGRCRIPQYSAGTYSAAVWIWAKGIIGATAGAPIAFPNLSVVMTYVPSPKGLAYVDLGALVSVTTTTTAFNSVQDRLYYIETGSANRITCGSEGFIEVKIAHTGGTYDKKLMRFGIILYAI